MIITYVENSVYMKPLKRKKTSLHKRHTISRLVTFDWKVGCFLDPPFFGRKNPCHPSIRIFLHLPVGYVRP